MSGVYFYTITIGFASGIFLRSFFDWGNVHVAYAGFVAAALLLVWWVRGRTRMSLILLCALGIGAGAVGALRYHLAEVDVSPLRAHVGTVGTYMGVVAREPEARANVVHVYVRDVDTGQLMLVLVDPHFDVAYGDRVTVRGTLTLPESFETDTGRTFDYAGYLKARGVSELMRRSEVTVVERGQGNPVVEKLLSLKHRFMGAIEQSIPEPAAGLGEGLLLGVKRAIGEELETIFRTVGIIHIVVLSGYNIMIVADSIMRVLGYVFYPRTRLVVGVASIALFALMVGLSATVVRAALMAVLVLVARALGRPYAALRALSVAGVVMLALNPYLIAFDPGFQLSFLATVGLVLFSGAFETRLLWVPESYGVRGCLATTLGTQLVVLPLLLFSMGSLSVVSVFANVLVLPLVPFAMLFTLLSGVAALILAPLGMAIGLSAYGVLMYIITIASILAHVPFASIEIPAFPWWGLVLMYVPIGMLAYVWGREHMTEGMDEEEYRLEADRETVPHERGATTLVQDNDLSGWTIETWSGNERTKTPGARSAPGESNDVLPFR